MIKNWEYLNEKPTVEQFFPKTEFFSNLNNSIISDEEYGDVKKLFNLLKMCTLSDLNALYNFQDTIIFTEIFQNRQKICNRNLNLIPENVHQRYVKRDMSKVIISSPTNADIIELMEKTLIGAMSVVE